MNLHKLVLALLVISLPMIGFAETLSRPCTRAEIDTINKDNLKYIHYFAEKNNRKAIEEIRAIKPPRSFVARHEAELKMLSRDANYQPSQSLCDDLYSITPELDEKIKEVAEKYDYPLVEAVDE